MIALISLIVLCFGWVIYQIIITLLLDKQGVPVEAIVIDKGRFSSGKGLIQAGFIHYIVYRFKLETRNQAKTYTQTQLVSAQNYYRIEENPGVIIKYYRRNPQISRLAGVNLDHTSRNFALTCGFFFIIVSIPITLWR